MGSLLQWAFYAGRKLIWHESIKRAKKIEHNVEDSGPDLLVWCDKTQASAHFARFPDELFDGEHTRQAVLEHAAPGVTIVAGMMVAILEGLC